MNSAYRVRKSFFGKCVLQKLVDSPSLIAGQVDATIRDVHWMDVDYSRAPLGLLQKLEVDSKEAKGE